jgi:ketol-acid reductoisomerase
MTKTPQQIKNEVEKEIEEYKRGKGHFLMKGVKEVMIRGISYEGIDEIESEIDILEAKLSILTEYDKSIKEMIEDLLKWKTHKIVNGKLPKQRIDDFTEGYDSAYEVWQDKLKELLNKIGEKK